MQPRQFKDESFAHFARIGAALGHAKRVEIVDVLAQGERSVDSLAEQISASIATTSHHLQVLAAAGLVTRRAQGTARIYRLADPGVAAAYRTLVSLAETHIAEVKTLAEAFFSHTDGFEPVSFDELDRIARSGTAMIIDVRPVSEYESGHVDGAINIPLAEIADRMSELPIDARIVAYCRGPYCVMAAVAVARLRQAGFDARRVTGWSDIKPGVTPR